MTYNQLLSMFADVRTTGIEYPSMFVQIVSAMSSWANLDFWSLFSFSCYRLWSWRRW